MDDFKADLAAEIETSGTVAEVADGMAETFAQPEPEQPELDLPEHDAPVEDEGDEPEATIRDDLQAALDAVTTESEPWKNAASVVAESRELDALFEPYKGELASAGLTRTDAIKQLVAAESMLRSDPIGGLVELAKGYAGSAHAGPLIERLAVELLGARADSAQLTGQTVEHHVRQVLAQERAQAVAQDAAQQYQAFMAKPPSDLESVKATMIGLLRSGSAKNYAQAYEQAVFVRDSHKLTTQRQGEQRKAAVARAKQAHTPRTASVPAQQPVADGADGRPNAEVLREVWRAAVNGDAR